MQNKVFIIGSYFYDGTDWWEGGGTSINKVAPETAKILEACRTAMESFIVWVKANTKGGIYEKLGEQLELLNEIYNKEKIGCRL